ncbi:MAG: class I SAM-dependent methyltransferase [Tepidiformaceae bacterium]
MTGPARPLVSFDRVAAIYDATRGFPDGVEDQVGDGLAVLLRPGARLLEVGIGTGRVAVPLAQRGIRVSGVDISRGMLDVLRRKRRDIDVVLAEAASLPFRPAAFDAALFVHILHLVPDPEATLDAALRVVRPGGLLLSCRTDHVHNALSDANELVQATAIAMGGVAPSRWRRNERLSGLFAARMAVAGASLQDTVLARWTTRETGRELLSDYRSKTRSNTWAIPDAVLPALIEHLTPELERMLGGLDTAIETASSFWVTVARLPGLSGP